MARQKWQEWAQNQDNLAILTAWARAGLTDAEIAKQIGISRSTLSEWKKKNDNIRQALSTGKEYADRLVENSLFRMTQGYEAKKRKAFKLKRVEFDEKGRRAAEDERIEYAEETEYVEPDIKAIIFWLKNRRPEIWKEKVVHNGNDDEGGGIIVLTQTQVEELQKEVNGEEKGK